MCAIVLFAIGGAFYGKLPMGEHLDDDEYSSLAWESFAAGGVWVAVAVLTGILYCLTAKKLEREEAYLSDTESMKAKKQESEEDYHEDKELS